MMFRKRQWVYKTKAPLVIDGQTLAVKSWATAGGVVTARTRRGAERQIKALDSLATIVFLADA